MMISAHGSSAPKFNQIAALIAGILLSLAAFGGPAYAEENGQTSAFVLLAQADADRFAQLQTMVNTGGGRVVHAFPYQAMIVAVSAGPLDALSDMALVLTGPADLALMDVYGPDARRYAALWNSLLTPVVPEIELSAADQPTPYDDAMTAPDWPTDETINLAADSGITPGYYQTSEFMAGRVAVGIVLVESNGTVDPSTENWTADEKQLVFSEVVAATNWWARLNPQANLSFVYDDHFSTPLPTGVEPISRPYYDQRYWIQDAMNALGYTSTSYFTQVRDYNNAIRDAYQTDWAFTIFVVDSSVDADNYFSNGYFAYAYLGGPFLVMTYGNNGYGPNNMDAVAAHEMGHIFYALDQYASAAQPCDRRSGYLYVENQNSQYGVCASNVSSIMRGLVSPYAIPAIDSYAAGQIGWRDSDGDAIIDPLDPALPVTLDNVTQTETRVTVSGSAQIVPYPSAFPNHPSLTINTFTGVQYRLDSGAWQTATPADGHFDSTAEQFSFLLEGLPAGGHLLEVAAVDTAGNLSDEFAVHTVIVGVDGLTTVIFPPEASLAGQSAATEITGLAYNTPGQAIAKVEYRINGGAWQLAVPQDGQFDSDYESFTIPASFPEAGVYLVEAFATDIDGHQEAEIASQEITVADSSQSFAIFLPLVIN